MDVQVGKEDVAVAEERALQLSTQLQRVKAMEEAARDMAASMQQKAEMLATTVQELERRALDSHEHAQTLHGQLIAARQKVRRLAASQRGASTCEGELLLAKHISKPKCTV